jgi:medium-chain acyl-[acyl-carrier-protein] hydrolase
MSATWLVRPTPRPAARLRLLCFPYAGVGPSAYRQWAELLSPDVEVGSVLLPGREGRFREAPFTQMEPLLDALTAGLRPYLDLPWALFGHSMGAVVAFEVARRVRALGHGEPVHLFVSARRAPHLPPRHGPISHLPDEAFVAEVRRRYDGIPAEVLRHPDLLALLTPGLRADLAVLEGHRHRPEIPLGCPLSAFGGREDAEATEAELAAWRRETRGPVSLRMFPGGHFFLQSARADVLRALAEDLALDVEDARGGRR